MKKLKEGYIKFNCRWINDEPPEVDLIKEMNDCRSELFRRGLIGMYDNGIGFGNISIRLKGNRFIISGTQTGGIEVLGNNHYTLVEDFELSKNYVSCRGPIKASSESLTHAVLYEALPEINAVIHIHSLHLWNKLLYEIPTTPGDVEYGTPEMAEAVRNLIKNTSLPKEKIFAMAGHEEGIVAFGTNVKEAFDILISKL